ncbi:class I SAM-dependent methyltransferase, partial [Alphaproteobacteria bacterium]|nr:class I SAM-dependent methyltransferase [Alphaproteobacteria bacterium]
MKPVGDFFSTQANVYAQSRPHYPQAFYEYFKGLVDGDGYIADIGAGSGQATYDLAKWFSKVVAVEPSERIIANLNKQAEIYPVVARAENLPIRTGSLAGVICAQSA